MSPRPSPSRVVLLSDPRGGSSGSTSVPIRRFRLARLRVDPRPAGGAARLDQIKRVAAE
jgi:hypothetical protein